MQWNNKTLYKYSIRAGMAICKPRHWNLGIGIGTGIGIGIETDITNVIISSFIRPSMDPKHSRVVTYDERTPPTKSRDSSKSWWRDKIKNVISPFSQSLCTPNLGHTTIDHMTHRPLGHVKTQRRYISTFIRPMDPKLSRILVTLWLLR